MTDQRIGEQPMIHDIEPAPVNHHESLELRIGRLEKDRNDMHRQLDNVTNELFRHIARDEPDPEPVTAGDGHDLRTAVARAINRVTDGITDLAEWDEILAEEVLKVATPIIRAQVIEDLRAALDSEYGPFVMFSPTRETEDDMIQRKTFDDWLRERKEAEGE